MKEHTTGERLRQIMSERGLKQVDILNMCKPYCEKHKVYIRKNDLSQYVADKVSPGQDKLTILSLALGVSEVWLMGYNVEMSRENNNKKLIYDKTPSNIYPIDLKRFPLLGEIACGEPIFAEEDHESYIMASADIKADFCLIAKGDSMVGARINDGDVVFIRQQPMVDNGEIAAVIIDGEATLKRWYYYPEKQKLLLAPANEKYEPFIYIGEELNEIRCLGKAVCFMSNL